MPTKYGRCSNIGNCNHADTKKVVQILDGQEFECPECGQELNEVAAPNAAGSANLMKYLKIGVPALLVLGGIFLGIKYFTKKDDSGNDKTAESTTEESPKKKDAKLDCATKSFDYLPSKPIGSNKSAIIVLGASGFDYFAIESDNSKSWKLVKSNFGKSMVYEGMVTENDVYNNIKRAVDELTSYGIPPKKIHFTVSSAAAKETKVQLIMRVLKSQIGYVVNPVSAEKEAEYALNAILPKKYESSAFVVDIGSGNTKIAWKENGSLKTQETYGAKYFQKSISDDKVSDEVKEKVKKIPAKNRKTCFIIGGSPFEMANQTRKGMERYTTLCDASKYTPDGDKQRCGINIYKAIADATDCEEFVFDWDGNYGIGFLLSLKQ